MFENTKNWILQNILSNVKEHNSAKLIRESFLKVIDQTENIISSLEDGISPISISPTITTSQLAALPDGVYRLEGAGNYNALNINLVPGQANKIVPDGWDVKVAKIDGVWGLHNAVKMPTLSAEGKVEEGNTEAVSGGEVFSKVVTVQEFNQIIYTDQSISLTFQQGSVNADGTDAGYTPTRIRSLPTYVKGTVNVICTNNQECVLYRYNQSGDFVDSITYSSSHIGIPIDGSFRLLVRYIDNITPITPGLASVTATESVEKYLSKQEGVTEYAKITDLSDKANISDLAIKANKSEIYTMESVPLVFTQGTVNPNNGIDLPDSRLSRIRSAYESVSGLVSVISAEGQESDVYIFNNNKVFVSKTGYSNSHLNIQVDGFFRVISRYPNDADITPETAQVTSSKLVYKFALTDSGTSASKKIPIIGNFDFYKTNTPAPSGAVLSSASVVYGRFDALVALYPQLISKVLRGYGGNAQGEADEAFPIYEYLINTAQTTQTTHSGGFDTRLHKTPKVLITSGVHGDEKAAVYSVISFTEQLLQEISEQMESLKSNVSIRIIPVVCPAGYNAGTRNNARGVNINRNFSYNWSPSSGFGSEPYSEQETKVVKAWFDENSDADAYIDVHNFTRNFSGRVFEMTSYHMSPVEGMREMYGYLMRLLSTKWLKTYLNAYADMGNVAYGFEHTGYYADTPATYNEAYHVIGIPLAATVESASEDPVSGKNTHRTMEISTELLINYILTMVKTFF